MDLQRLFKFNIWKLMYLKRFINKNVRVLGSEIVTFVHWGNSWKISFSPKRETFIQRYVVNFSWPIIYWSLSFERVKKM